MLCDLNSHIKSQIDQCTQVVCVNSSLLFEYYKRGMEAYHSIQDYYRAQLKKDGSFVYDVLQGTKCGSNAVSFEIN